MNCVKRKRLPTKITTLVSLSPPPFHAILVNSCLNTMKETSDEGNADVSDERRKNCKEKPREGPNRSAAGAREGNPSFSCEVQFIFLQQPENSLRAQEK